MRTLSTMNVFLTIIVIIILLLLLVVVITRQFIRACYSLPISNTCRRQVPVAGNHFHIPHKHFDRLLMIISGNFTTCVTVYGAFKLRCLKVLKLGTSSGLKKIPLQHYPDVSLVTVGGPCLTCINYTHHT